MLRHNTFYVLGLVLLSGVMLIWQGVQFVTEATPANRLLECFLIGLSALDSTVTIENEICRQPLWEGRVLRLETGEGSGKQQWRVNSMDLETGSTSVVCSGTFKRSMYGITSFADRFWVIENGVAEVVGFHKVEGHTTSSQFVIPRQFTWEDGGMFVLNGKPSLVERYRRGFLINSLEERRTVSQYEVILPVFEGQRTISGKSVKLSAPTDLTCLNHGDQIHAFVISGGYLLHRQGIDLKPFVRPSRTPEPEVKATEETIQGTNPGEPDENTTDHSDDLSGWSLVSDLKETPLKRPGSGEPWIRYLIDQLMFVGDQPVVMLMEQARLGRLFGYLYRFDGTVWYKVTTKEFPFGTSRIRTVSFPERDKSVMIATTLLESSSVYIVDSNGIRDAGTGPYFTDYVTAFGIVVTSFLAVNVLITLVYGIVVWVLMRFATTAESRMADQTIRLASLGRRMLARLIDMLLIIGSGAALFGLLTIKVDWTAIAEAINLNVDHSEIRSVWNALVATAIWIVSATLILVYFQGKSGRTPGKWICGLRTVRKSLQPPGVGRSLFRELFLYAETLCLFCWVLSVFSISLTRYRQRVSDMLGDTVVVENKSLTLGSP